MDKASYYYLAVLTVLSVSTTAHSREIISKRQVNVEVDPVTGLTNIALNSNPEDVSDDQAGMFEQEEDVGRISPVKPTFLELEEPHLTLLVGSLNIPSSNLPLTSGGNDKESIENVTVTKAVVPSLVIISNDKLLLGSGDATSESKVPELDVTPIVPLRSPELEKLVPVRRGSNMQVSEVNKIVADSLKQATGSLNLGSIDVAGSPLNLDSVLHKGRTQGDLPGKTSLQDATLFRDEIPMSPAPPTIPPPVAEPSGLLVEKQNKPLSKLQTREEPTDTEGEEKESAPVEEVSPVSESIQTPEPLDSKSPRNKPKLILGTSTELPVESTSLIPVDSTTVSSTESTSVVPLEPVPTTEGEPGVPPVESSTVPSIDSELLNSTLAPTKELPTTSNPENPTSTSRPGTLHLGGSSGLKPGTLPAEGHVKPLNATESGNLPVVLPGYLKPEILNKLPSDVLQNLNMPPLPSQIPGGLPGKPILPRPTSPLQGNLPGGIHERPENQRPPIPFQFQNLPGHVQPSMPESIPNGMMRPLRPSHFGENFPNSPPNLPPGIPQMPSFPGNPQGIENLRPPPIAQNPPNFPGIQNMRPPNLPFLPDNVQNLPARLPGPQNAGFGDDFRRPGVQNVPRPSRPQETFTPNGIPNVRPGGLPFEGKESVNGPGVTLTEQAPNFQG
ncbi:unnamed protein product [Allacma fusca]|uniref:Uncharacterized protein n=1 Tax=Allacma fusca TaxID=39272 RepID=A0A8J2LLL1_9HEXA|nr:unnamed protein product [Allacma fusca]